MTDIETTVRNLAVVIAVRRMLDAVEKEMKSSISSGLKKGRAHAFAENGDELGKALIYERTPTPKVTITDEAQLFPWLVEEFGPEVIEQRVVLTEQGRKSFEAYMLEAHKAAGSEDYFGMPGASVTVAKSSGPIVSFTPEKNVVELVRGMAARGELDLSEVLALEGGDPS